MRAVCGSSATQLTADRAVIDTAKAQLAEAKQNLALATLTNRWPGTWPRSGLPWVAGSGTVTIVGSGMQKVSTAVPPADVDLIKAGQSVGVAADGVAGNPACGTSVAVSFFQVR
jgi:hypothetical protein